ncbi:aminodeoxychorismate synthase component I [Novosphingobium mangrovi (ex Hu et al. 2023)]|uniref:Probable branched-chain-amino-acid aminotransferase n=1 Tax=Novosphingobium mangrovi (ex Hu et al. 2023) TaxID=2930094 RepID=A0ABT0AD80_9SPHN|nr:aminodeoxychorismate synthase component I [Novosphingobium mangrovi (ex Hu et al. 2023)]MCJ1961134.1 aminodeoxychorismate synthase component I [Novosphingobium mangrovi (ex Hu et al. 2023)]
MTEPFILLDDARTHGAVDARLYRSPVEIVSARAPEEVLPALARMEELSREGLHLAGYMTYEAGLVLEAKLERFAGQEVDGPLLWFGAFTAYEAIASDAMELWLSRHAVSEEAWIGPMKPVRTLGEYSRAFDRLQEAIHAGDIYQANLTMPLEGPWQGDPLGLYAKLRPASEAGYGGVIYDGRDWHLSLSPELFFQIADGTVHARPMKGTRPRGRDLTEDAALRAELSASVKDRAENLMILDLMRNDLSRVAEPGSVRVPAPFAIESYPTVHQMVSSVEARLEAGKGPLDLLRALFPCGSITGAPKIRAMELIEEVEQGPRGVYCGSIGHIEPTGDAAFNVAIRTLRLAPKSAGSGAFGGRARLGVGSAIVADSQSLPEWRECLVKGGFVRGSGTQGSGKAPSPARFDLIETMRFTPDEGIPLLEMHLERMKASAAALGFVFDRHAVRNAIQALCFDAAQAAKLRLVTARSGAYALELAPLPETPSEPIVAAAVRIPVDSSDWRLAHKTSDRAFYEASLALAREAGAGEALLLRDDGRVTEGSFTNIFVERGGVLLTPPATLGLLPGVLRRSLLESGRAQEADLTLDDLVDGFFLGNAVRGLFPARLLA